MYLFSQNIPEKEYSRLLKRVLAFVSLRTESFHHFHFIRITHLASKVAKAALSASNVFNLTDSCRITKQCC